jgi:hypothetical protein
MNLWNPNSAYFKKSYHPKWKKLCGDHQEDTNVLPGGINRYNKQ